MPATTSSPSAVPAIAAAPAEAGLSAADLDYLFDIRGFRIIPGALGPDQLEKINTWIDAQPLEDIQRDLAERATNAHGEAVGRWIGDVETFSYGKNDGLSFQNIVEGGGVFEELIDHAAWIDPVRRYIENDQHRLSIDETLLNIRQSGGYIPIHSGGATTRFSSVFRNNAGRWMVGQINIFVALTDIGEGDGPTTVIPGSHKSQQDHPMLADAWTKGISGAEVAGMVQVHLRAGDALMFTDAICHGSMPRANSGQRRICLYRYSPHLMAPRYNYLPTDEMLSRLTPARREILQPVPPRMRPGREYRG